MTALKTRQEKGTEPLARRHRTTVLLSTNSDLFEFLKGMTPDGDIP